MHKIIMEKGHKYEEIWGDVCGAWMGKEGRETCYYVVIFKKKQLKTAQDVSCLI